MYSRMNNAEEQVSYLEARTVEITQSGQQTKSQIKKKKKKRKKKKKENNVKDLWDNIKHANLHIIGVSEGEERERGIGNVFEGIMAENFPNQKKETDTQIGSTEGLTQDEPKQTIS